MADQTINVNFTPGLFQPTLYYSQNDVGRVFKINLEGLEVPSGATVTLQATKPSGLGFVVEADSVDSNVATFTTVETMTNEWGRFPAEVHISSGSVEVGTANLLMVGERNPHPEGTTDGDADKVIPELTLLVQRIEAAADAVDEDVTSIEGYKTAAETAATNAASSESNAAGSATAAASSATSASGSATSASESASAAAASAATAQEAVELSDYGLSVVDGAINITYVE